MPATVPIFQHEMIGMMNRRKVMRNCGPSAGSGAYFARFNNHDHLRGYGAFIPLFYGADKTASFKNGTFAREGDAQHQAARRISRRLDPKTIPEAARPKWKHWYTAWTVWKKILLILGCLMLGVIVVGGAGIAWLFLRKPALAPPSSIKVAMTPESSGWWRLLL